MIEPTPDNMPLNLASHWDTARRAIEDAAREQLAEAFKEYPMGCDEDQMRAFLKTGPYPNIAYAIAMGWDWKTLINNELQKYGNK